MRLDELDEQECGEMCSAMAKAALDVAKARGVHLPELILIPTDPATITCRLLIPTDPAMITCRLYSTMGPMLTEAVVCTLAMQLQEGFAKLMMMGRDGVARTIPEHRASGVPAKGEADDA